MALTGSNNEQKIWNYLKAKGLNDYGAAGLMGNLYAESALIPTNLQNTYEKSLGYTDAAYTAAVDNGSYSNFVRDSAGYGLAQWTYWSRKQGLLEYAKAAGKSIGDLEMQLDFLMKELSGSYGSLLALLKSAASVKAASDAVLTQFERPADQSDSAKTRRASYGQTYYTKFAGTSAGDSSKGKEETKVKYSRQAVVDLALSWVGKKESDGSYKSIIDIYNTLPASQHQDAVRMGVVRLHLVGAGGEARLHRHHAYRDFLLLHHRERQEDGLLGRERCLCPVPRRRDPVRLGRRLQLRLHGQPERRRPYRYGRFR